MGAGLGPTKVVASRASPGVPLPSPEPIELPPLVAKPCVTTLGSWVSSSGLRRLPALPGAPVPICRVLSAARWPVTAFAPAPVQV